MTNRSSRDNPWGRLLLGGIGALVMWKALSPEQKRGIIPVLDELAAEGRRKRLAQQAQAAALSPPLIGDWPGMAGSRGASLPSPSAGDPGSSGERLLKLDMSGLTSGPHKVSAPASPLETDARLRGVITHPSVVIVLGKRGSGKSALGYRLLELFRYGPQPYVVGIPNASRKLLPDWIGLASGLEKVPPKAIALVDEAYLAYHARGSMAAQSKAMSQLLNLSRQREQTLVFVSQEARQVDRNIASSANVVIFKDLGMLQLEFDRPEINKLAAQAGMAFAGIRGDRRSWAYVYAPDNDFLGLLENELPSFWKPGLSKLFASESLPAAPRAPRVMTVQEKAARAKQLRAQGHSYSEIAMALGVSRATVVNYLRDYPYRDKKR